MKEVGLYPTIETAYSPFLQPKETPEKESEASFGTMLKSAIKDVAKLQNEADEAIQELAAGKHKSIHRTMIALEKADVSFQLMMQVRNKVIAAYEEIMRMQV